MSLWARLENITRDLELCNDKVRRLSPESPVTKLKGIQDKLFKQGVTYSEIRYIKDMAQMVNVVTGLRADDFMGESNMGHVVKVDRVLDKLLPAVIKVKEQENVCK